MWLDQAVRQEASKARERLRTWADAFQVSAAAATLRAVEAPHDPGAPLFAGWSAIATILSVASSAAARAQGRLADDPPAEDFPRSTRAFHRKLMRGEVDFLVEPLGEAGGVGLDLSRALFDDSAETAALVRSFERAQGALLNDAPRMVQRRLVETQRHADRSVEALLTGTALADRLADSLKPVDEQRGLLCAVQGTKGGRRGLPDTCGRPFGVGARRALPSRYSHRRARCAHTRLAN